jgi:colanic acid/amylovoran biosynthesis glycosyltransferase
MRTLHYRQAFSKLSETFIYDYLTELERQGVENNVVTWERRNADTRPFRNVVEMEWPSKWDPRRLLDGMITRLWGRGPIQDTYRREARRRVASEIRRLDPDVIHAHFGPEGVFIAPAAERLEIPLVVSFHGYDAFKLPRQKSWRDAYSALFRQAECITVVSNVMAEHLTALGAPPEKVTIVHVGKQLDEYRYRDPATPVRNWISVGRLTEKKGFGDCITAFRGLLSDHPESTLDIIGQGECFQTLKQQIESAGLTENVRLLGRCPHSEVKKRMDAADGFVLCSKEAEDGDWEGIPTVLMEAQAVGLPVVSTVHSGIPEAIPPANHHLLAEEGNVEELTDALCSLAETSVEELRDIAKRGRERVEEDFNLNREVEKLRSVYQAVE